jgi:tetratricopeptide (TPR) repeat protein
MTTSEATNPPRRPSALLPLVAVVAGLAAWFGLQDLGGKWINRVLLYAPGIDKIAHGLEFMAVYVVGHALAGRWFLSASAKSRIAIGAALVLAVADESQQALFSDRSVSFADLVANLCGIGAGLAVTSKRWPRWSRWALAATAGAVTLALATTSFLTLRHFNRGLLLEARQQFAPAREAFLRALASGYESAELYNSLGWVEIESGVGDPASAVEYAGRALAMRPDDANTLDTYGWALHHVGRNDEALEYLRRAYEKSPKMFCIHHHLGMVLLALGRREEAVDHFRRQIAEHPRALEADRAQSMLAELPAAQPSVKP